ncbi:major facilitator superfamily transporter [Piedraia hortae CBS 480.64]|uniref:Major facilitator superfamily transporter n=1 Tax=Piedraia hortae CBS 480.64 TaxID=1314780 RepID=A0A6A7C6T9_9PEZI|nr:major facilitator superfamily transporter [Piedraia hortae CBS 480.64]
MADVEKQRPVGGGDDDDDGENSRPACFRSTLQEVLFVLTATMAVAMSSLLVGSVTVTSSFIGRDLNMSTAEITWLSSSCSLSSGAFLLFFGKAADLFGRKVMFIGSMLLFSVFAIVAGFAKSAIEVDVINGVLGLTCAASVPPAVGILGLAYDRPSKRKNYAFACFSAGNPLGYVVGSILGGLATSLFGWSASFWLMAIIFGVFAGAGIWTIPADTTPREPFNLETPKKFDVPGVLCIIFGIGMLTAALSLGSTASHGWKSAHVLGLLIASICLLIIFVCWDLWYKYPLVPMWIWKDANFSLCMAILVLGILAFTPAAFFLALYFQDIKQMSALQVAVHILPMAVMGLTINVIAGLTLHKVSNKMLMLAGTVAYSIAFLLMAMNRQSSSYWAFLFPAFCIVVAGTDFQFNVTNMYVMSSMPASQQSIAGGIFQTASRLFMALGLGAGTAIFNSVQQNPVMNAYWDTDTQPYAATCWFAFASSVACFFLIPFLTLNTQGGKNDIDRH